MNISDIDLNLLVVFDAILTERSVTAAARRIGLSQPAVSHALRKLRTQIGEALFVRTGRAMRPTPRALDLAAAVRPALEQLQAALQPERRATVEVAGIVAIGMDDYLQAFLLPGLARNLERAAPGVILDVWSPGGRRRSLPQLRDGRLDLAVDSNELEGRRNLATLMLFEDRYVCLARSGLAGSAARLSEELFAVLNHVESADADSEWHAVHRQTLKSGLARRVSVTLPGLLAAPWLVAVSDAVALVPARLAKWFAGRLAVDLLEPPIELPPARVVVRWHRRAEQNRAVMKVRDALVEIGRELQADT